MMLPELNGLIAAAHTPFDGQGDLNVAIVAQQASLFREMGLIGVFVGGSTGEWFSLSLDERRAMTEAWIDTAGDLIVIAHVGGVSLEQAQALAEHAQTHGVDAISCLVQGELGVRTAEAAVEYLAAVASAAPATSVFYYDMEAFTGIDVPLDELLEVALDRVPTLAGAKYTGSDLATLTRAQQVSGALQILMGRDEMLLGALATGVKAAVGSTYNYAAPVYQRIFDAVARGDLDAARVANVEVALFVKALLQAGVLPGAKAIMGWMGVDVGRPRPPHDTLDASAAMAFHSAIVDMNVFARQLQPCH